jgi:hypothetical protein
MSRLCSCGVALFVLTIAAFMSGCGSSSPPILVSLSPSSPQGIDVTQTVTITATVTNDSSSKGVTWTLTGPGSLSSSVGLSVAYISPATQITSAQQVTVTATSAADQTKTASLQITVNPYPVIPFQTIANGSVGAPYSQMIALTGGTPPFQWSVYNGPIETGYQVGGSVPDGLQLNSTTGVVSGTPTGGGTWYFETIATDATGAFGFNALSIQIAPTGPAGNPVPFLNQSLVPTAISPGNSNFSLVLSGTGFVPGAGIDFDNTGISATFVDSEHLSVTIPAANVATARTAAVSVINPPPGGGKSNVVFFQVARPEASVTFAPAANSPFQIYVPSGIAAGDFNEDGKQDIAVTGGVDKVYTFLGNGDGTFAQAANSPMQMPSPPYDDFASPYVGSIVTGDFNRSGHLGLATELIVNEAAVILLGHGDGTFAPSSASFVNAFAWPLNALDAADFNADGNLDLVVVNGVGYESLVALGYGDGAFNAAGFLPDSQGFSVGAVAGDFNGDGKLDVIVANSGYSASGGGQGSGVTVWLGNGDGTFTLATGSPISVGSNLSAIVAADFNGDGKLDLAVTDSGDNAVIILLGNGDGTFRPPTTVPVGNDPDAIVAGDFNNDGKLDLAIANSADATVALILGNGDGTFTQATGSPYVVGRYPYQIAAADFNGDGKLDLAVANLTDGTVSILLQQ